MSVENGLPLISVIVPVYKVEKYLDKCVESIVKQTYKNLEIILVDDGSPDRCPEMCDEWSKKDSRVKVIHKENGGLSDARNAGLNIATGALIGFVDSDDYIDIEMYEMLYNLILSTGSDISACGVQMVWENGEEPQMLTVSGEFVLDKNEAMKAVVEESWLKQPVWYKLYKRACVERVEFPVGKCHEDVFWTYPAVANANKVAVSDFVGYYYLQRNGSIMGTSYSLKRLDGIEAKEKRVEFISEHYPKLEGIAKKDLWLSCLYQGQKALAHLNKNESKEVLKYLKSVQNNHLLGKKEGDIMSFQYKIWYSISKLSFILTCRIRNTLKIGI